MAKILYVLTIFCVFSLYDAKECINKDPCSCKIDEYTLVDLEKIQLAQGAFFQDGLNDVFYFFSGCKNAVFKAQDYKGLFGLNQTIDGVSLVKCILNKVPIPTPSPVPPNDTTTTTTPKYPMVNVTCTSIGEAKQIKFNWNENPSENPSTSEPEIQILYTNTTATNNSLPSIRLMCNSDNSTFLKILSPETDALELYSPGVCVQHTEHDSMSGGAIFCTIFFVAVFAYFVGGALVMYFIRGARGAEVIPNFDFWVALPGLMKDGMIFILSGCRPYTVSTAETYDRI